MRKVLCLNGVGIDHLSITDTEHIDPEPGEVRFKVHAFALNRADILYITGDHYTELQLPSRVGSEASGIVDAIGPGVINFQVGDYVSSVPFNASNPRRHGVQGEFAIVPESYLVPWPKNFSAVEACSIWMQYLTAYFALITVGKVDSEKMVLIAAGASSAGVGAIHMAKAVGAKVIATTRTREKKAFLKKVGADHVIITEQGQDFATLLRSFTDGKGVDMVFDPISGSFVNNYINGLNWNARILIYGMLEGMAFDVPILPIIRAKASIHPYSMFNHVKFPDELKEGIDFVMYHISDGKFRPLIDRVINFENTVSAYQYMLGNTQCGKIVVAVDTDAGRPASYI